MQVGQSFDHLLNFYLGYTRQGSEFNNAYPKMAIKKFTVGSVSENTGAFFLFYLSSVWENGPHIF